MGSIVAALASSHAFALMDPSRWDHYRERNRMAYARRYGTEPPIHPRISGETDADIAVRYRRIRAGLDELRNTLMAARPDVLLLIGDDQSENYTNLNVPQIAIYTGHSVMAVDRMTGVERKYSCATEASLPLLEALVEMGFDVSFSEQFVDNRLLSHAHSEPLIRVLVPDADIPIVPLFVNAIHWPGPTPARCYAFGQALGDIIRRRLGGKRIAIYASGGLSHFTAGYPWKTYSGEFCYGSISEEFDRRVLDWMRRGDVGAFAKLTSADLLAHGEIELRSWIVLLGAVGPGRAEVLAYEPFYRGLMGMGVARWPIADAQGG